MINLLVEAPQISIISLNPGMLTNKQQTKQPQPLQHMQPLLHIINSQEHLYFQALAFTNKHINNSSSSSSSFKQSALNHEKLRQKIIDEVLEVKHFLDQSAQRERQIQLKEMLLWEGLRELGRVDSRYVGRVFVRVLEVLEVSVERGKNSVFGENGRLGVQFLRFKISIKTSIRKETIDLTQFSTLILNFVKNKYQRQISKIRTYLTKLQQGEYISLRELFLEDLSSHSCYANEKSSPYNTTFPQNKKPQKYQSPQQQPQKNSPSPRKYLHPVQNKKPLTLSPFPSRSSKVQKKSQTANLLYKNYSIMQLLKKQFLQDYIFPPQQQHNHRNRLLQSLLQKNNKNLEYIQQYSQACESMDQEKFVLHLGSEGEGRDRDRDRDRDREDCFQILGRNFSACRGSMRASFVISRRKGNLMFEGAKERSDNENSLNHQIQFSRTIKNFSTFKKLEKRQISFRPKKIPTRKIFVTKAPMTFNDEIIPKAQMSNSGWIQAPLTGRDREKDKTRRAENLRIRRRNNQIPLDQRYFPQTFRITHYHF